MHRACRLARLCRRRGSAASSGLFRFRLAAQFACDLGQSYPGADQGFRGPGVVPQFGHKALVLLLGGGQQSLAEGQQFVRLQFLTGTHLGERLVDGPEDPLEVPLGTVALVAVPMFFGTRCMSTWPTSLKIVGHGAAGVHGAGLVTSVWTSDVRFPLSVEGWLPCAACSESITSTTGARPSRTTSPQEVAATAAAEAAARMRNR